VPANEQVSSVLQPTRNIAKSSVDLLEAFNDKGDFV
jgi:hypothetical protein